MADITLRILGQEPLPLNLGSDNSETLSVGSGVTEGRLQEVLTDYVPKSDIDTTLSISGDVAESKTVGDLLMALFPTDSASGAIASFSDGADNVPVKSLSVTIEPKQSGSGTPAPDNVRPISGWNETNVVRCGKNLIKNILYQASSSVVDLGQNDNTSFGTPLKAGTYTISYSNSGQNPSIYIREENDSGNTSLGTVTQKTFTIDKSGNYRIWLYRSAGVSASDISNVQLELGSTKTDYVPYTGETYTIPLPSTVYGGILNVDTGVLTVTKVKHTVTSDDSTSLFQTGDNANRVGIPVSDAVAGTDAATRLLPICNISQASSTVPFSAETQALGYCALYNKVFLICVPTTATNVSAAKSWLVSQGCEFVYPLATPTTIPLTPTEIKTLLGDNNIFADSGSVSVVYSADIAKYIDKRLGA